MKQKLESKKHACTEEDADQIQNGCNTTTRRWGKMHTKY